MASREYYTEVIDEMRKAQGKLTNALYSDLDRLASAESNSAKVRVQESYERGVNEAFEAIVALFEMHPLDLQEYLEAYELDDMKQFLKSENRVERVKQVQQTVRAMQAEEFKCGDEVFCEGGRYVVLEKMEGGKVLLFDPETVATRHGYVKRCVKSGRHFVVTEMMKTIEEMRK